MLFIPSHFPCIGLAKADHADTGQGFCKYQHVDPAIDQTERAVARLGVVEPVIQPDQRGFEFKMRRCFKSEAAFNPIALVLGGIEFDTHELCVYNNSGGVQIFVQAWTRWQAQEPIDSWSVTASSRLK